MQALLNEKPARTRLAVAGPAHAAPAAPPADVREDAAPVGSAAKVMIVDDEPINIKVARKYLQNAGYANFVCVSDSTTALEVMRRERPDVILTDVMMPGVTGLDLLRVIRADEALRHLPVLVLTASTDSATKLLALQLGATDFLAKPVDPAELAPRVRNALVVKAHHDHLERYSAQLEREVRLRTAELEASRQHVIHCLARAAERRDDCTGNHVVRVGRYAAVVAHGMGLAEAQVEMLELAALLHDVGKIGIPDAILLKPAKLTAEEFAVMRQHCTIGENIIAPALGDGPAPGAVPQSPLLSMAARIAASHHERWDGTGYPRGLAGEAIAIEGRITAVADVFDALSSKRPYKEAMPLAECLGTIRAGRGSHFDPRAVDALFAGLEQILAIQRVLKD